MTDFYELARRACEQAQILEGLLLAAERRVSNIELPEETAKRLMGEVTTLRHATAAIAIKLRRYLP